MDKFKAIFFEEAIGLITELERVALLLSNNTGDQSIIGEIFRIMHTLKGNSSMFGFNKIGELTHHLETIYDLVRDGKMTVSNEILNITFLSLDHLKELLNDTELTSDLNKKNHNSLLQQLSNITNKNPDKPKEELKNTHLHKTDSSKDQSFAIYFKPKRDVLMKGTNTFFLIDDLSRMGNTIIVPHIESIPEFKNIDTEESYLHWEIYLSGETEIKAIRDVFMFVEDDCELKIHSIAPFDILSEEVFLREFEKFDEESFEEKISVIDAVSKRIQNERNNTEVIPKDVIQSNSNILAKDTAISSIRVNSEKLDVLLGLVSELVTTQAGLNLFAHQPEIPTELKKIAENIEKITRQLRDNTFSICLVPIESMLVRFQRLIRDLSNQLNKDIKFISEGADTELDKSIIENLSDPLMHMFRNCIDHGIETTEERLQKGKTAQGTILLKSFYSGNHVIIQIKDDGKGIDPAKVHAKALSKNLITKDQTFDKKQLFDLLFLPGFSTAEKVTEVSGRGVGMDVVKRQITDLRGEVDIESEIDKGTTITIRLPLTLSIIDGLLVKINTTHFVIPLANIDKCYEARHNQLINKLNDLIVFDGEQLPYIYLRDEFNITDCLPTIHQIIVIKHEDRRIGLVVDTVVGEYQAVLKPLGKIYKNVDVVSGATILGNGNIALLLDPFKIISEYSKRHINIC